jgi:hypothetical protein
MLKAFPPIPTVHLTPYLEQVREALSQALSSMEPYHLHATTTNFLPIRPHVEVGTEPVHTQLIEGKPKTTFVGNSSGKERNNNNNNSSSCSSCNNNDNHKPCKKELCLIESTSNSVRVSFLFKQQWSENPLEVSILFQWLRFLQQQAEDYGILRRKPVEGYSITFLICNHHLARHRHDSIDVLDTILSFCALLDKECSDIKIQVNAEARHVATEFFKAF